MNKSWCKKPCEKWKGFNMHFTTRRGLYEKISCLVYDPKKSHLQFMVVQNADCSICKELVTFHQKISFEMSGYRFG